MMRLLIRLSLILLCYGTWDPAPSDTTYLVDYEHLLRTPEGTACEYDRHIEGLFARSDWIRLLNSVGFEARGVPFEHSELEPVPRSLRGEEAENRPRASVRAVDFLSSSRRAMTGSGAGCNVRGT